MSTPYSHSHGNFTTYTLDSYKILNCEYLGVGTIYLISINVSVCILTSVYMSMCNNLITHILLQMGDPMQLLRINGRKAKIHLDPAVAAAGDSKTTMSVSIGIYY